MQKNWLIRTKSNHILGPVSKEKILELITNGSIRPDDEICSGNGYWFFMREQDLVDEYLHGGKKQSFNPISEARDVLTAENPVKPEIETQSDSTLVGQIDLSEFQTKPQELQASTSENDLALDEDIPELIEDELPEVEDEPVIEEVPVPIKTKAAIVSSPPPVSPGKPKKKLTKKADLKPVATPPKRVVSDKLVLIGSVLLLVVLVCVIYFRKRILNEFLQSSHFSIFPSAYAQESDLTTKKKNYGNL